LALGLVWLVAYPLLLTLVESVRGPAGWTLEHVVRFASDGLEWRTLWASIWIAAASVTLAALIGVPLAFVIERYRFFGRGVLGTLAALPIALPPLAGVLSFVVLFGEGGFAARLVQWAFSMEELPWRFRGAGAILFVHAYSLYVYFYLFTRVALRRVDASTLEAAEVLGASKWRAFTSVTLPVIQPALAGAAVLTFLAALASFSVPYVVGGDFRVMTTAIVATRQGGDIGLALVETVALATVALGGLVLLRRTDGRNHVTAFLRITAPPARPLRHRLVRFGASAIGWAFGLVLLLPHITLLLVSFVPAGTWSTELFPPEFSGGNFVALVREPERLQPILASLPWAVPAMVFAVALATTFGVDKIWAGRWTLVGTFWILPLAYLVRSLPITTRGALAGFRWLHPSLEEAAASLGARRMRRLRHVTLPILQPALGAAAVIAFVTVAGDFVTSIALYTESSRPISLGMVTALHDLDLGMAAAYGSILMVASVIVVALGERR
jgi:iron(III) transport system permease protein